MIPGSVSRLVEGVGSVPSTGVLTVRGGEVVKLAGGTYNTINPPLGNQQNQVLWIVAVTSPVILGISGNITNGITIQTNRCARIVWLKSTQKWHVDAGA